MDYPTMNVLKLRKNHIICLIGLLMIVNFPIVYASPVDDAIDYLDSVQDPDGGFGDFGTSCWVANAYKAYGTVPSSLSNYLQSNHQSNVDTGDVSQVSRFILAATASGLNPRDLDGVNYGIELQALHNGGGSFGDESSLYDDFWALIALSSMNVQNDVSFIKENQNPDGGWGWAIGQPSDCDDTAAAIMALRSQGTLSNDESIEDALTYLQSQQMPDGGFPSWGASNSDTDSWSISSIQSCGQDASTWGINPIVHLESLQQPDGSIYWQPENPGFNLKLSTSYGIIALSKRYFPVAKYVPVRIKDPTNESPRVQAIVSNMNPAVGETVFFSDISTDDGKVKECSWYLMGPIDYMFEGFEASVTFEKPGYYLVRHRVYDNKGKRQQEYFYIYVEVDDKPPVTQAYKLGGEGFVVIYFEAVDTGIGVKTTYWKVNNIQGEGPLILREAGSYEIEYWSIDKSGNVEEIHSTNVTIEGTALPEPI
jgi:hypothetical protein